MSQSLDVQFTTTAERMCSNTCMRVCSQGSEAGQRDAGRRGPHKDRRLWHVQRKHVRWNNNKDFLWNTRLHRSRGVFTRSSEEVFTAFRSE